MTTELRECQAVRQLWAEEALGRTPSADEIALRDHHVARCAACRVEAEVLARLQDPQRPGPAPALDDLARRRWIDQTFERAERALAEEVAERGAPRRPIARFAAIAAAVALAAGAALYLARGGTEAPKDGAAPTAVHLATRTAGRMLLTSGEVSVTAASDLGAGELGVGGVIATGAGTAIAALDGGILLHLDPGTTVRIEKAAPGASEVRLERGELFVSVDPNLKGRRFGVLAGDGAVRVTGTIFSVEKGAGGASVCVFRGSVVVEGPRGDRPVRIGERLAFGAAAVAPIGDAEKARAEADMDAMSALALEGAAALEVESLPAGAIVSVDGTAIGGTPLIAALRPGYRRLELSLDGRESVRELLRLAKGAKTARVFDLAAAPAPGAGTAAAAAAAASTASAPDARAAARTPQVPPPEELLATARDLRAARDFTGAIGAYERLVAAYPETPLARTALVSLGQIYLDQGGNPGRALELFRRYLAAAGKGALAQEASWGAARASRSLGDPAAERAALEAFLRDFGGSAKAKGAAERLTQLP
jgi:ferric-dicitrate binding protein FerR (iron transport regulator)/TolA-binding protein